MKRRIFLILGIAITALAAIFSWRSFSLDPNAFSTDFPSSTTANLNEEMAALHLQQGEFRQAALHATAILEDNPDNEPAQQILREARESMLTGDKKEIVRPLYWIDPLIEIEKNFLLQHWPKVIGQMEEYLSNNSLEEIPAHVRDLVEWQLDQVKGWQKERLAEKMTEIKLKEADSFSKEHLTWLKGQWNELIAWPLEEEDREKSRSTIMASMERAIQPLLSRARLHLALSDCLHARPILRQMGEMIFLEDSSYAIFIKEGQRQCSK